MDISLVLQFFLVSQEVSLNFHRFVGKIVGGVGGEGIYKN